MFARWRGGGQARPISVRRAKSRMVWVASEVWVRVRLRARAWMTCRLRLVCVGNVVVCGGGLPRCERARASVVTERGHSGVVFVFVFGFVVALHEGQGHA